MKCCVYGVLLCVFTDLFTWANLSVNIVNDWLSSLYIAVIGRYTLKKSAICHSDPHSYDSRLQTYVTKINSWGLNLKYFRLCFQIWILKLSIFNAFCSLNVAFNWILIGEIMECYSLFGNRFIKARSYWV